MYWLDFLKPYRSRKPGSSLTMGAAAVRVGGFAEVCCGTGTSLDRWGSFSQSPMDLAESRFSPACREGRTTGGRWSWVGDAGWASKMGSALSWEGSVGEDGDREGGTGERGS